MITEDVKKQILELAEVSKVSLYQSRRYSQNICYQNTAFSGSLIGMDDAYFDVYNYYVQYYTGTFQHGGISLQEMLVPLVTLTPKQ